MQLTSVLVPMTIKLVLIQSIAIVPTCITEGHKENKIFCIVLDDFICTDKIISIVRLYTSCMPRTNIYCLKQIDCQKILQDAKDSGLQAQIRYPLYDPTTIDIDGDPCQITKYYEFLQKYESYPDIFIYYDRHHPKCLKNVFQVMTFEKKKDNQQVNQQDMKPQVDDSPYIDGVPEDITPYTMKSYYKVPIYDPQTVGVRPKVGVISLGGYYQMSDLNYYWTNVCHIPAGIGAVRPTVTDHVVGDNVLPQFAQNLESIENTLDLELIGGFCPNVDLHFYSAINTYNGFRQAFLDAIGDSMNFISVSWGQTEEKFYGGSSLILNNLNTIFDNAKQMNIIITAAAGDYGSSDNNFDTISVPPYPTPVPVPHVDFPASSPNVVACGGTTLFYDRTNPVGNQETAWVRGGGGQSTRFARPTYQGEWSDLWPVSPIVYGGTSSPNARTIPDVAFNADENSPWHTFFSGYDDVGYGTSASAPIMAGMLAIYYSISAPDAAPRQGYFGEGFNFFLYQSPTACTRVINYGYNNTVEYQPMINAINPYGILTNDEKTTFYAIFRPAYSFCSGKGAVNGTTLFTYLNSIVCVGRGTQILMSDGHFQSIETIQRGQKVIGYENHEYTVALVNRQIVAKKQRIDLIEIQPSAIEPNLPHKKLVITPNHPIFYRGARRPAKCFKYLSNVIEHKSIPPETVLQPEPLVHDHEHYILYDLQFEVDGSYIAEGVTIQSRSPWSDLTPLERHMYFHPETYSETRHWDSLHHSLPLANEEILP
jgi:hypothetical protein